MLLCKSIRKRIPIVETGVVQYEENVSPINWRSIPRRDMINKEKVYEHLTMTIAAIV